MPQLTLEPCALQLECARTTPGDEMNCNCRVRSDGTDHLQTRILLIPRVSHSRSCVFNPSHNINTLPPTSAIGADKLCYAGKYDSRTVSIL